MPGLPVDVDAFERLAGRASEPLLLPELVVLIEVRFLTASLGTLIAASESAESGRSLVMTLR